jgi:hypothetical protein
MTHDPFAPSASTKGAFGEGKPVGTVVTGKILDIAEVQSRNLKDNALETWADGNPKMVAVVKLQTAERDDEDDDGVRAIYAKGGKAVGPAGGRTLLEAIKLASVNAKAPIAVGGELTVKFKEELPHETRGFNAHKLYTAKFVPGIPAPAADPFADDDI